MYTSPEFNEWVNIGSLVDRSNIQEILLISRSYNNLDYVIIPTPALSGISWDWNTLHESAGIDLEFGTPDDTSDESYYVKFTKIDPNDSGAECIILYR